MFRLAIDGPVAAGKTTMAKQCAQLLNLMYLDTGALYRAFALACQRAGVGTGRANDEVYVSQVTAIIPNAVIAVEIASDGSQRTLLNGEDVTPYLRTPSISMISSTTSAIPAVRAHLLTLQQDIAKKSNVVMEGRDIGTVIIPDAELKIFLTADLLSRAKRRFAEYEEKGEKANFHDIYRDVQDRDKNDSSRKESPLTMADDAILLDNSNMTITEVANVILALAAQKLGLSPDIKVERDTCNTYGYVEEMTKEILSDMVKRAIEEKSAPAFGIQAVQMTQISIGLDKLTVLMTNGKALDMLLFRNRSSGENRLYCRGDQCIPYIGFKEELLKKLPQE